VCSFSITRDQGVTRPDDVRPVFFPLHTCTCFSPGSCADRVSQKSDARIRSAIHDLHVPLVRTLPRGTGYFFFYLFKRLRGSVPARVRKCSSAIYKLGSELVISLSFSAASVCPEPFCNSSCVTLLDDVDGDGDDDGSGEGGDEADDGDVTTKKTTTTTSRNLARPRMGYESEAADPSGRPSLSDD